MGAQLSHTGLGSSLSCTCGTELGPDTLLEGTFFLYVLGFQAVQVPRRATVKVIKPRDSGQAQV